jgi:exopolyphosphatase/guanosine-5'-triphosphate,3'-diphosphate pyrophosphatase
MTASSFGAVAQGALAAVDLGSNSFHMVIAQPAGGRLHVIDRLKETVRLAAGLNKAYQLDAAASARALACLERFGQRLRAQPLVQVRAVGTQTLRRVKPPGAFIEAAEAALGHPIEVIYGVEEARLIYAGVTLDLGAAQVRRLVVDIGGGSTEFIAGDRDQPRLLKSLNLGAIAHSRDYFPGGIITARAWRAAVLAARLQLAPIARAYRAAGWDIALGASGSIKAIAHVCAAAGWMKGAITPTALARLARALIQAGHIDRAELPTLSPARRPIFTGAAAVLTAIFEDLGIQAMQLTDKALREGLLLDLLGRAEAHDRRETSVVDAQQRYAADIDQAARVAATGARLLADTGCWLPDSATAYPRLLHWAAQLHEIGATIAYKGYHKHSAYIVRNADLAGFSQSEQLVLSVLLHLHRGQFRRGVLADLPARQRPGVERLAVVLRLAVLLNRSRDPKHPPVHLQAVETQLRLLFDDGWLDAHPLTRADLLREAAYLDAVGYVLQL